MADTTARRALIVHGGAKTIGSDTAAARAGIRRDELGDLLDA